MDNSSSDLSNEQIIAAIADIRKTLAKYEAVLEARSSRSQRLDFPSFSPLLPRILKWTRRMVSLSFSANVS